MDNVKGKIRKLKYRLKHGDFFAVENVVLVLAVAMCLVWTYQSIEAMARNWELVERLNTDKKSLELLEIEVEAAELENGYYASEEYRELAARKFADKQLPGENMVYLPENSEAAKNKHKVVTTVEQEKQYTNFDRWWKYLFP